MTTELTDRGGPRRFWMRRLLVGSAVLGILLAAAALRIVQLAHDPHVFFLSDEAGAEWIRADVPFSLATYGAPEGVTVFQHAFTTKSPVEHARLVVRAFRRASVTLDEVVIDSGTRDADRWKQARSVSLPSPLEPGRHLLQISVSNPQSHACLLAHCKALDIRTGPQWQAARLPGDFAPAIAAALARPPELATGYPTVSTAFAAVAPWLAGIFLAAFAWTWWNSRPAGRAANRPRWRATPKRLRWLLLAGWVVLAANNIWRVPVGMGFDLNGHYEYIQYLVHFLGLPLATDGWQMFQPPLFYLLAAPWYAVLLPHVSDEVIVKVLRVIPLLCGLAQIEIVYRAARTVFPDKEDLQTIATVVGGLLPMQIYISLVIGNEPLAGCLTAVVVLTCFKLLVDPQRQRRQRFFIALGVLWGLALLSKLTPLLLAPLVAIAVLRQGRLQDSPSVPSEEHAARQDGGLINRWRTWAPGLANVAWVCGACGLTSAWYYLRNWYYLGKPFIVGSGDPVTAFQWWQDPSYRTWGQLTSFGTSLVRPVYAGCWSLWDSLYSTLWLDGFMSGTALTPDTVPWNLRWMEAGAWLAFVPMGLLFVGCFSLWQRNLRPSRSALVFSLAAVAIYLAAIVDLYVRLPIYSTAKATYMVGLLPCYAVLAAAGAAPFLRVRLVRAFLFAALCCWAVAAYAAYFVR